MQKRKSVLKIFCYCLLFCTVIIGTTISSAASDAVSDAASNAVNVILKNNSSSAIEVEMIDQYGGNVTISIDAGTSQNHTLKLDSEIKVKDGAVRKVTDKDEGKEVSIAGE